MPSSTPRWPSLADACGLADVHTGRWEPSSTPPWRTPPPGPGTRRGRPTTGRLHPPLHVGHDRQPQGLPALAAGMAGRQRQPRPFLRGRARRPAPGGVPVLPRRRVRHRARPPDDGRTCGDPGRRRRRGDLAAGRTTMASPRSRMPGLKHALTHPMADKVDRSSVRRVFGGRPWRAPRRSICWNGPPRRRVSRGSTARPRRATS